MPKTVPQPEPISFSELYVYLSELLIAYEKKYNKI
jgi:hypothetical protein